MGYNKKGCRIMRQPFIFYEPGFNNLIGLWLRRTLQLHNFQDAQVSARYIGIDVPIQ